MLLWHKTALSSYKPKGFVIKCSNFNILAGEFMTEEKDQRHNKKIVEQFTKQAVPFSKIPGHLDSMQVLVHMSGVKGSDKVLDVACGPGLVACEFAKTAEQVTGIDITAKMIERAQQLQWEKHLTNMAWKVGDVFPLPYPDASFSVVLTRYSFHHFTKPTRALSEMIRVCRSGGRVLVADVALPPEKVVAYDHLEKLRDPSHAHALSLPEFERMFQESGLTHVQKSFYTVSFEVEQQLKASFPNPGDEEKIRAIFKADIGKNQLGIGAHYKGNEIHYAVPIAVFVGQKKD